MSDDNYSQRTLPSEDSEDESLIRSYLLGEPLAAEERDQLEKRLAAEEEYFAQMQLVEAELIDDYVLGVLPERERENFERHFLSTPERRTSVEIAESLRESCTRKEPRVETSEEYWERRSEWSYALVFTGFPIFEPEASLRSVALLPTLAGEAPRKENVRRVNFPTSVNEMELELTLEAGSDVARHYRAEVHAASGEILYQMDNLQARQGPNGLAAVLSLPANLLPENDYAIRLYARGEDREEIIGSYLFTVIKQESTTNLP
jgi:hypothetical protein